VPVVHCKSGKPFDIYVGRPSIFGNPWTHKIGTQADFIVATREEAVNNFREWLEGTKFQDVLQRVRAAIRVSLPSLKDKTLACWCGEKDPCHAKVLSEMANGGSSCGDHAV